MLEVGDEAVPAVMGAVDEVVEAAMEAVVEAAVEAVVEGMTTMTTRAAPHPLPSRVFPDVYDYETDDVEPTGSSTTPRCNNN